MGGALCEPRRSYNKQVSLVDRRPCCGSQEWTDSSLCFLPEQMLPPRRELLQHLSLPSRVPRECNESLAGLELRSTLLAQWSEEAWAPLLEYHVSQSRHGLLWLTMSQCLRNTRTILPLLAKV